MNGVVQLPYLADLKRTIWCSLGTDKKTSSRAQLGGRVPTARLISFEEGFHTNKIHDEQFSPWFHNSKSYPTFGYKVMVPHFDICKLCSNVAILPFGKLGRNFFLWFIDHNFFLTLSFDNLISLRVLPFFVGCSALSKINKLFEVHLTLFLTVYWAVKFIFPHFKQTLHKLICIQINYISLETSKAFYFQ